MLYLISSQICRDAKCLIKVSFNCSINRSIGRKSVSFFVNVQNTSGIL
uniref:Uncharacterized protein n=1 Tax=Parascaris equorum TaxID=6256 RepID=A0A914RA78_PAREQ